MSSAAVARLSAVASTSTAAPRRRAVTTMSKRFIYCYFMKPLPGKIREAVPRHVDYWKSRRLTGYLGGPFADRTGGLIAFDAANIESATSLAEADPFVLEALIESKWIKEWIVE